MIFYLAFYRACLSADGWETRYFLLCCASNLGIFRVLKSKSGYFLWFSKKLRVSIPITSILGVSLSPQPPGFFVQLNALIQEIFSAI